MTKVNERKRKLILAGAAFALCITIMLTGTFAWQSLSQYALNETMGEMSNPGGRLHDDFNGSNKDIYIENFTGITDGMPIIVRIRLYEYMEIGEDAGKNLADPDRNVTIKSGAGADINAPLTWDIYKPGDNHYGHWTWGLGGQTVYMPTFNKNKDSKDADINGTYEGTNLGDVIHFDDYKTWQVGDTLSGTALYDGDEDNDIDEGNTIPATETHTAKNTIAGTVMNMADWTALPDDKKLGDFWVYDTDGWAYWANPLMPDTATGLLLSGIQLNQTMTEKWYYGIYVESQMVTADEIADAAAAKGAKKGFYHKHAEDGDGKCTDNECPGSTAQMLLDEIIAKTGYTAAATDLMESSVDVNAANLTSLEVTDQMLGSAQLPEEPENQEILTVSEGNSENEENPDDEETDGQETDAEASENETDIDLEQSDGDNSEDEEESTTPGDATAGSNEAGNMNPDSPVTETDIPTDTLEAGGTSQNEGIVPQESESAPAGISEELEETAEPETTG